MSRGFRPILTVVVLAVVALALNACDDQEQALVSAGQSESLLPTARKKALVDQVVADGGHDTGLLNWSAGEKALLDTLSIKHLDQLRIDPSNRYQTHPQAISFGSKLFFDPRLSDNGKISCSTCHSQILRLVTAYLRLRVFARVPETRRHYLACHISNGYFGMAEKTVFGRKL